MTRGKRDGCLGSSPAYRDATYSGAMVMMSVPT